MPGSSVDEPAIPGVAGKPGLSRDLWAEGTEGPPGAPEGRAAPAQAAFALSPPYGLWTTPARVTFAPSPYRQMGDWYTFSRQNDANRAPSPETDDDLPLLEDPETPD